VVGFEPRVDEQKLRELLDAQHEHDSLEYISACDLDERRDVVELAREVAAMASRGGYIVVGVDDHGQPEGRVSERQAKLYDDATLRDKLDRYLPSDLQIHVARHQFEAGWLIVIHVAPHPDGAVVFKVDGTYEDAGKPRTRFRAGELFVRHGSKSERPNQNDIARLAHDAVEQARLWSDQLERVAGIVNDIGQLIEEERPRRPDGRVASIGQPTRIPTARMRLRAALTVLERLHGPRLPACWSLAESSHYVFLNQMFGDVYLATSEIAAAAAAPLKPASGLD
jgi:hypothetical protein